MNRQAYLSALDAALTGLVPDNERADVLRYYQEYFDDAGPEREAEVIRELGDPAELARRIAQDSGYREVGQRRRSPLPVWAIVLIVVAAIAAAWGVERAVNGIRNAWNHVETPPGAVTEVTEGTGSHTYLSTSEQFHSIDVDIGLGNVVIQGGGSEYYADLTWSSSLNYSLSYTIKNGELKVTSSSNHKGLSLDGYDCDVTIVVPSGVELQEVDVETGLGDVTVMDTAAQELSLKTGLGDLTAERIEARESMTMETGMGTIGLNHCPLAEETELETGMGDVCADLTNSIQDCGYELEAGMGQVSVDGEDRGTSAAKRGGAYRLEASSGMGNIDIFFGQ